MKHRKALLALLILLVLLGSGMTAWQHFQRNSPIQREVEHMVAPYRFRIGAYEVGAITAEIQASIARPGTRLPVAQQQRLVYDYLQRAQRISMLEQKVAAIYADSSIDDPAAASADLRRQLAGQRNLQGLVRPAVETILQRQITAVIQEQNLDTMGVVWPPVRFNFSEPPRYLIVSPRDRISLEAGVYLRPALDLNTIELLEQQTATALDRSTIIEPLGGLGIWPTMVIDQASLRWVLSTIAHEWVHNYMVFYPLGWHLFDSPGMNTVSESIASLIGDEIGNQAALQYYGLPLPTPAPTTPHIPPPQPDSQQFDFNTEMRRTRVHVDKLLELGMIEEAEAYMEVRRREFVEHGYALRKLNQAYFAFHGSYATHPSAIDPIGPKLQELRSYTPDLATFLREVRQIKKPADIDTILERWRRRPQNTRAQLAPMSP